MLPRLCCQNPWIPQVTAAALRQQLWTLCNISDGGLHQPPDAIIIVPTSWCQRPEAQHVYIGLRPPDGTATGTASFDVSHFNLWCLLMLFGALMIAVQAPQPWWALAASRVDCCCWWWQTSLMVRLASSQADWWHVVIFITLLIVLQLLLAACWHQCYWEVTNTLIHILSVLFFCLLWFGFFFHCDAAALWLRLAPTNWFKR